MLVGALAAGYKVTPFKLFLYRSIYIFLEASREVGFHTAFSKGL